MPSAAIDPMLGLMDQVTDGLFPVTVALNCWLWLLFSVAVDGPTLIEIGIEKSTGPNILPTVAPMKLKGPAVPYSGPFNTATSSV